MWMRRADYSLILRSAMQVAARARGVVLAVCLLLAAALLPARGDSPEAHTPAAAQLLSAHAADPPPPPASSPRSPRPHSADRGFGPEKARNWAGFITTKTHQRHLWSATNTQDGRREEMDVNESNPTYRVLRLLLSDLLSA